MRQGEERVTPGRQRSQQVQYYHYKRDHSVAGLGTNALTGDQLEEISDCNQPVASRWKPVRVVVLDPEPKEPGDFPVFYDYPDMPVFSQRAWDVLSARIACRWEALPIIHPSKRPFYFIHVMEVIDCVDRSRSEMEYYNDGSVASIERFCLRPKLLVDKHIFRTPFSSGDYLLVDDVFRQVVEEHKLKGLKFNPIPRVDAPG
jgi:hypothetical protein